ncbi:4Fe-4S dicluster domain-containing protein [Tropicibacter oceani]|uniref:Ferredoxin n=1 Tax=Tropicibacter oceani TaxID=3058420 RepID=A0ABY8QKU6_9RHOB|nr:ferredoxin [Tropicibacter oceani]WGW05261.1 ferredoxin [Tropicibacter oceani]
MTSVTLLDTQARAMGLRLRGALHPTPEDDAPDGSGTVLLLGPDEPAFWGQFTTSAEYQDGLPDPLDRWSKRCIGALADSWGGTAVFPSDGPPYPPFIRWAERSGQAWPSPVQLLVQADAGLFISYRGAVALPDRLALPTPGQRPCDDCATPCSSACPVGALREGQGYDVPACMAHLRSPQGAACRDGCLVRRACPVARDFSRDPRQSAFHMAAFLGE